MTHPLTHCPCCGDLPSLYGEICMSCAERKAEEALSIQVERLQRLGYGWDEIYEEMMP